MNHGDELWKEEATREVTWDKNQKSDRDRIMEKKQLESINASWNSYMERRRE